MIRNADKDLCAELFIVALSRSVETVVHTIIKLPFLFVDLKPRYHVVLKNSVDKTSLMACGNDGGTELKVHCVHISYIISSV